MAMKIDAPDAPGITVATYDPVEHGQFNDFLNGTQAFRLKPYAVVLTNHSGQGIHALTVRWIATDTSGRENVIEYATDAFAGGGSVVDNHDTLLLTPSLHVKGSQGYGGRGYTGPSLSKVTKDADRFDNATARRVAIDTIILDNGDTFGADVSNTVGSLEAREQAIQTVVAAYKAGTLDQLEARQPTDRNDKLGTWVWRFAVQVNGHPTDMQKAMMVEKLRSSHTVKPHRAAVVQQ